MTTFSGHLTDAQAQRIVDDALLPAEADEVRAHAAGCADCQALVHTYRLLGAALEEELQLPDLPLDFTDGVLARIETRERATRRERRLAFGICAAVLAAITAAAAFAGAAAWAPASARLIEQLGAAASALRLGAEVLPPIVSALRPHIALACAMLALPLLFALSRLIPSPRTEIA